MMSSSNNSGYITVDQANKMLLKQNTVNTSRDPRAYSKVAIPPISTNLDISDRTSGISSNSTNQGKKIQPGTTTPRATDQTVQTLNSICTFVVTPKKMTNYVVITA